MRYRKKPVVIEAMRYGPGTCEQIARWMDDRGHVVIEGVCGIEPYAIHTLEGIMNAMPGDWIIKGVKGEFYPCKPDIFEATYAPESDSARVGRSPTIVQSDCTLCASVESVGFYTGCMIRDKACSNSEGWVCDGRGHLARLASPSEEGRPKYEPCTHRSGCGRVDECMAEQRCLGREEGNTDPTEYDTKWLLDALLSVYARSCTYQTRHLHDRWVELRREVERRLGEQPGVACQDSLKDMEARKDAAYEERNKVVAALAWMALGNGWCAGTARTSIPGWSEDWHGCVYIDLPSGQTSWHYHDSHAPLFEGLPTYMGEWDGHDTPEKYRRVAALSGRQSPERCPIGLDEHPQFCSASTCTVCVKRRADSASGVGIPK